MLRNCFRKAVRAPLPWGLLAAVGLIAILDSALARHRDDFSEIVASNWEYSSQAARCEAVGAEVLFLGDSVIKQGLAAPTAEAVLGKRVFNLAVCSGNLPTSYFLFRRSLEAGARPKAVVLDFELDGPFGPGLRPMDDFFQANERNWPELLSPREALDLAWLLRDPRFFGATISARLLPPVRVRQEVRNDCKKALLDEQRPNRQVWNVAARLNWQRNAGSHINPHNPAFAAQHAAPLPDPRSVPAAAPPEWTFFNPVSTKYARRLLMLARDRGIVVFLVQPPISPKAEGGREACGVYDLHTRFAQQAQALFPEVAVIDGRRSGYDTSAFFDITHMERRGAAAFGAGVGTILRDYFANPGPGRWYTLPRYDPSQPLDAGLEDCNETKLRWEALQRAMRP